MKCHSKFIASMFLSGMIFITGFTAVNAAGTDFFRLQNGSSPSEEIAIGPSLYARNDGTWEKNESGVWTYRDSTNQLVRNCWVRDGDKLFFVGYDGCLVKDNYSSDGFYLGTDGAWDSTRSQRTWEVDPYEGAYEGAGNIWIFSLPRNGTMDSMKVAYKQTGEIYMTYTLTSVGHGCFMAWPQGSEDLSEQMLIAVSDDKNSVRISTRGITQVCVYTPNSYYYDPAVVNNNQNNNSQTYYEFVFPYSGISLLEDSEVANLTDYNLRIALNEIYARHGRRFKDKELQNYFNNTSWYVGQYEPEEFDKIQDSLLNDIEKKNINKLVKERNRRK